MDARTNIVRWLIIGALGVQAHAALAGDAPAITPYRPSVSNPAQLPATGQLELEAGWLAGSLAEAHRNSIPVLLKYAFSERWGVLLGGEAWVGLHETGASAHGVGDTNIVLKRAFTIDEASALGLELGAKLPTASTAIGSGHADYTLNAIASRDLGRLHLDANANLTRPGAHEPATSGPISGLSAALSSPLDDHWGALAELSGTRQHGVGANGQALLGLTYSPSKRLTFDLGLSHGVHAPAAGWSWFSGVVLPLNQPH